MTTLANPVFSADFSIAVVDSAIYYYNPKTTEEDGHYSVGRVDTFYVNKEVFKLNNNFIIYTWKEDTGKYDYKIQFNTLSNGISTKIN